jgi:hypothetical protein
MLPGVPLDTVASEFLSDPIGRLKKVLIIVYQYSFERSVCGVH